MPVLSCSIKLMEEKPIEGILLNTKVPPWLGEAQQRRFLDDGQRASLPACPALRLPTASIASFSASLQNRDSPQSRRWLTSKFVIPWPSKSLDQWSHHGTYSMGSACSRLQQETLPCSDDGLPGAVGYLVRWWGHHRTRVWDQITSGIRVVCSI